jgi:hypothetical protein
MSGAAAKLSFQLEHLRQAFRSECYRVLPLSLLATVVSTVSFWFALRNQAGGPGLLSVLLSAFFGPPLILMLPMGCISGPWISRTGSEAILVFSSIVVFSGCSFVYYHALITLLAISGGSTKRKGILLGIHFSLFFLALLWILLMSLMG